MLRKTFLKVKYVLKFVLKNILFFQKKIYVYFITFFFIMIIHSKVSIIYIGSKSDITLK